MVVSCVRMTWVWLRFEVVTAGGKRLTFIREWAGLGQPRLALIACFDWEPGKWADRQAYVWMKNWMGRQRNGHTDGWINTQTDRYRKRWTKRWIDRWTDKLTDKKTDWQKNGQKDGETDSFSSSLSCRIFEHFALPDPITLVQIHLLFVLCKQVS